MTTPAGSNRPVWESEKDYPELSEKLREELRSITDPELGLNIIQLGLVRNVVIGPDSATIHMILTTPFCPYGPAMLESTRQKAESVLQRPTQIQLSMEMWDFSMMEEGLGTEWGLY